VSALAERIEEGTARMLAAIVYPMGAAVATLAGIVALMHVQSVRSPSPREVATVNLMTMIAMAVAVAAIVASEFLWKSALRRADEGNVNAVVRTAFVARTALREGAALLGGAVALVAARNGTLRVYPAYWADLAPAALFLGYLVLHRPTLDNLRAEVAEALPR